MYNIPHNTFIKVQKREMIRESHPMKNKRSHKEDIDLLSHRLMELDFKLQDNCSKSNFIISDVDKLKTEFLKNKSEQWWGDTKMSRIIWNLNMNIEKFIKRKEEKSVMKEAYSYPNPIVRKIELFGFESLSYIDHLEIFKIKLFKYISSLIEEKWKDATEIDIENFSFKIGDDKYYFMYEKLIWSEEMSTMLDIQDNSLLIDYIRGSCQNKHTGIITIPEILIKITGYN